MAQIDTDIRVESRVKAGVSLIFGCRVVALCRSVVAVVPLLDCSRFVRKACCAVLAGAILPAAAAIAAADGRPMRMILDADTANEIDDYYAIVRALLAPELCIEGLTAASFRPDDSGIPTVMQSQQANEEILALMNLTDRIPALSGADGSMPDTDSPLDSPAVRHIIARAHAGTPENPLWVVALGQCTNLASALLIDPSIADRVRFAFIDGDFKDGRWGPGIYNWKNDIAAVKVLLESDVPYFHMPARSVSGTLKMKKTDAIAHLQGRGGIHDYLLERWENHRASERPLWTMWDIALIEALLRPELARAVEVGAPIVHDVDTVEQYPENPRRVTVWIDIDVDGMLADFWQVLDQEKTVRLKD